VGAIAAIGEGLVELGMAPDDEVTLGFGGDAANICVMAARLGAPARLAGRVGRDPLGARLLRFWRAEGVDVGAVGLDDAPTGLYVNALVADGEHRFSYWRRDSAGSRLCDADLAPAFFADVALLVVTGVTLAISRSAAGAARAGAAAARAGGARVVCVINHRPALGGDPAVVRRFASGSDVVIGSREDARSAFGAADIATLLPDVPELVLTDGAGPVAFRAGAHLGEVAVPPARVRNAAGAGDAFAGAYLARRLRGDGVADAVRWGVAAATLSVGRDGCAAAYPARAETAALAGAAR
jgi:2-dehydro-3-deoxygluconokinase